MSRAYKWAICELTEETLQRDAKTHRYWDGFAKKRLWRGQEIDWAGPNL